MPLSFVLQKLYSLDDALATRGLENVIPFNKAYQIVTKNFQNSLERGIFRLPEGIIQLDNTFADLYFQAVEQEMLPEIWQSVIRKKVPNASKLFSLLLGANVHINHDLPLAIMKSPDTERLKKDFFNAKPIFISSILEILLMFDEKSRRSRLRRLLMTRSVVFLILHWRKNAWKRMLRISSGIITKDYLVQKTLATAKKLTRLEKIIG